jgi:GDP-4-dehydro-6-deoxy-D-mannose reductase
MVDLILGAAGFVGGYAIRQLAADGAEVHAAMRPAEQLSPDLAALCTQHTLDLLDADAVHDLLHGIKPDRILHLAAQSSVAVSWKQPQQTAEVNIIGTLNLLEAARTLPIMPRILLVGSGEEYGAPAQNPVREEMPLHPANIYAATKAAAEQFAAVYYKAYHLPVICVRAFNHIGPMQREIFVTADFCKQAAEIEAGLREPVIRTGNLSAKRDFTDVRDIVRAYALLLECGRAGEIYNVGSGNAVMISDILSQIQQLCHVPFRIETDPAKLRPVDVPVIAADIAKLQAHTGWTPEIPLAQTLADTLEHWRSVIKEQA